jgi:eukaryotic-like serine/threonine-protein kinase
VTPTRWQRIEKLIDAALEKPPAERPSFVKQHSEGDVALEQEVLVLLDQHEKTAGFLDEAPVVPPDPLQPGEWVGPYRVERELGRGGMGRVLLAVRADDQFRKHVAIKVLHGGLTDPELLQRFRNERQILASLDHPNIARVLDGGSTRDGTPYFVMDYVEGVPIDVYCREHQKNTREILELFRKVCDAVTYAHSRLVVHRDLKPGNILVSSSGEVKLLDFGIAKLLSPEAVQVLTIANTGDYKLMTPKYASPEQIRGGTITTATDVYSLGVILYELLTGRPPYDFKEAMISSIERVILTEEPQRPSTVITKAPSDATTRTLTVDPRKRQRELTGDLDTIVLMALRKEPERRYPSVERFSLDIQRHLEGQTVSAQPATFRYLASKFLKRNRYQVAAGTAIAASLVIGIVMTTMQKLEADRQRARAEARMFDIFELTNSFLNKFHDELRELPGAGKARQMVLEETRRTLERLEKNSDEDRRVKRRLAPAYSVLATMTASPFGGERGDPRKAAEYTGAAAKLIEEAFKEQAPQRDEDRDLVASIYSNHADMLMSFDLKGALEYYGKALKARDEWRKIDPNSGLNLKGYALLAARHGDLIMRTGGSVDAAIADYRKAVEIADQLVAKGASVNPKVDRLNKDTDVYRMMRLSLIPWHGKLARALQQSGRSAEALAEYEKSAAQNRLMIEAEPMNATLQPNLAVTMLNIATIEESQGALEKAIGRYREAIALLEPRQESGNAMLGGTLATAYSSLADVLTEEGRISEALASAQKNLALREQLAANGNPEFRAQSLGAQILLGQVQARAGNRPAALGNLEGALRSLEELGPQIRPIVLQSLLWTAHFELAQLQQDSGAARRHYDQAIALAEKLAATARGDVGMQWRLARSLNESGAFAMKSGDTAKAIEHLTRGSQIAAQLTRTDGQNRRFQQVHSMLQANLAEAYAASGKTNEALQLATQAVAFRKSLAANEPSIACLRTMGQIYTSIAAVMEKAGRKDEAQKAYSEGVALMERARAAGLLYPEAMQVYQQLTQGKRRTA